VVVDPERGVVLGRAGTGLLRWLRRPAKRPSAVAAGKSGSYLVADVPSGSVTWYDAEGAEIERLGQGVGEFVEPVDVAVDPDPGEQSIWVVDGGADRVQVYAPSGALVRSFGGHGAGPGQFDFPVAVYVSPSGEVFVGDQNNDRVQVFTREGTFLRCFGSNSTTFSRRFGRIQSITGDGLGRIYVADAFQSHVRVFDAAGVLLSTIGGLGSGAGELRTPAGMTLDRFNRLFVSSRNNGRVEVYGIDDYSDPQPAPGAELFADGFESGDAHRWTGGTP